MIQLLKTFQKHSRSFRVRFDKLVQLHKSADGRENSACDLLTTRTFILIFPSHNFSVWKENSYKCIFNKLKSPRLSSANSSLHVFSKSWQ